MSHHHRGIDSGSSLSLPMAVGVQLDGSRRQDVEIAACIVFVDVLSLIHTHSGLIPKHSILWHVQKVLVWFRNVQSYSMSKVWGLVDKFGMRTALWFRCSMEPYSSRASTTPTNDTTENDDGGRNLINKQFSKKVVFL
jgi:hypothetical protein